MGTIIEEKDRQVVPRWRSSNITLKSGELASLGREAKSEPLNLEVLEDKLEDWEEERSLLTASDLVQAAFVLHQHDVAEDAARFLLTEAEDSYVEAKEIAQIVTGEIPERTEPEPEVDSSRLLDSSEFYSTRVRELRSCLRDEPRNSIARVDLALAYVNLGLPRKAEKQIDIALSLAGSNRFVLRSANRMFLHIGDYNQAHRIVRRADPTPHDPWLLAAEIATASVADRSSGLVKRGKSMIDSGQFTSFQTAELASAIATIESKAGNRKESRQLFHEALKEPTENAVAQAEWVSRKLKTLRLPLHLLENPNSFEARAWHASHIGNWESSLRESLRWLNDQPFSRRAVNHAGYVASVGLEEYDLAVQIYRFGLKTHPNDPLFINNLAYALASQGYVDEASKEFGKIKPNEVSERSRIVLKATRGLLLFRLGKIQEGRQMYQEAIEQAKSRYPRVATTASIVLAREEFIAKTTKAHYALKMAVEEGKKSEHSGIRQLLRRVKQLALDNQLHLGN